LPVAGLIGSNQSRRIARQAALRQTCRDRNARQCDPAYESRQRLLARVLPRPTRKMRGKVRPTRIAIARQTLSHAKFSDIRASFVGEVLTSTRKGNNKESQNNIIDVLFSMWDVIFKEDHR
jgi:hypothetical protein